MQEARVQSTGLCWKAFELFRHPMPHPLHIPAVLVDGDNERVAFLRSLNILDTPGDVRFDRFTEAASTITHSPISLISLVDSDRLWFKSRVGVEVSETSRDLSFSSHVIADPDDRVFVVCDTLQDKRFMQNDYVIGEPFIRFYAGVPLIMDGGNGARYKIGTLCILDVQPRKLESHHNLVLESLAKLVVDEVEKCRAIRPHQTCVQDSSQVRLYSSLA